ncbi:MAG TPA: KamA family radical SAM protein [Dehalococcoidia bacterium]|nr:KamA family radical SAM protein [Dehalococcoidia bacterium]
MKNTIIISNKPYLKEDEDEPPSCIIQQPDISFFAEADSHEKSLTLTNHDEFWNDWKWQFRHRISTVDELSQYVPLSDTEKTQLKLVTIKYPLSITPYYLSLINPLDPNDPIKKQAIPSFEEIALSDIGEEDPLAEHKDSAVPGLVHRYPDRVLMVLTNLCPMLCRHCTRKREWRHGVWVRTSEQIESMLDYVRRHKEVRDVILSGGDPLTLSTQHLERVISRLRQINHVEIIRIGSRFPVTLPQRIDAELCNMLSEYGPIWLNTHFNHYREITLESAAACDMLLRSGVPVNNQSVLLRGVNDSVEVQRKLCQGLLRIKVRPYYLYQCDEVQGTEHLRTPVETGLQIIEGLRGHTSGLAVPAYVIDLPEGGGKVPIQPSYILKRNRDELILRNYEGGIFRYRNPRSNGHRRHSIKATPPAIISKDKNESVPVPVIITKGEMDENRAIV